MAERASDQELEKDRTRGWLFLWVEEEQWPAEEELNNLFKEGKKDYSVIRADQVELEGGANLEWNVVIPVDAKDDTTFNTAKDKIKDLFQTEKTIAAMVVKEGGHHPWPPHNAHGYVTEEEFIRGKRESDFWHGLQGNSPGRNPWG